MRHPGPRIAKKRGTVAGIIERIPRKVEAVCVWCEPEQGRPTEWKTHGMCATHREQFLREESNDD